MGPLRLRCIVTAAALAAPASCSPPRADDLAPPPVADIRSGVLRATPLLSGGVEVGLSGSPVELLTTAIGRDEGRSAVVHRASEGGPRELVLDRGSAIERFQATPAGIEQSWVFEARPEGSGDLVVRVALRGTETARETTNGIVLAQTSGRGLRYGMGVWIDALGRRTKVRPRLDGQTLVLTVPGLVIDQSAFPAILDPTISAELSLSPPILGSASGLQFEAKAAFDGTNHFVVWYDQRQPGSRLYGARISPAGALLDPVGIGLTGPLDDFRSFDVSSSGGELFVAWNEADSCFGRRVTAAGVPSPDISPLGPCEVLSIAPFGSGHVAARIVANAIEVALLDGSGASTEVAPYDVYPATSVKVASGPQGYVLAWESDTSSTLFAGRVDNAGNPLDPPLGVPIAGGDNASSATPIAVGDDYLVFWNVNEGIIHAPHTKLMGSRLDGTGASPSFLVRQADANMSAPVLSFDGSNSWVAWHENDASLDPYGSIRAASVSAAAQLVVPPVKIKGKGARDPALTCVGGSCFVAWESGEQDIVGLRIGATGAPLDAEPRTISQAALGQQSTGAATDGKDFLVTWEETGRVKATGVAASGAVRGDVIDLGELEEETPEPRRAPAVAFDGTAYFTVWLRDKVGIVGAWVKDGVFLKDAGVILPFESTGNVPSVACASERCLVAWLDADALRGVLWSRTRGRLSEAFPVSPPGAGPVTFAVGSSGTEFFVVWEDHRRSTGDIAGSRVTLGGEVLDPEGVKISDNVAPQSNPAIGFDGSYLVVWQDVRNGGQDIYGRRVHPDGTPFSQGDIAISLAPGDQFAPRVSSAGHGGAMVVAWTDHRNANFAGTFAARVTSAGDVVDPEGIDVTVDASETRELALATSESGVTLVAYSRFDVADGAFRVRARLLDSGLPQGDPCRGAGECATGHCVDGFCCDSACKDACATCSADPGSCTDVVGADDPGTCEGISTCDSAAACKLKNGRYCLDGSECASGVCVDGTCCDRACGGGCESCTGGSCQVLRVGEKVPSCAPYLCAGEGDCPSECSFDEACALEYRCDSSARRCVLGSLRCDDNHTLVSSKGDDIDCLPYRCSADSECLRECGTTLDCAPGFACDPEGRCATPPRSNADGTSCGLAPGRSTGPPLVLGALVLLAAAAQLRRTREARL